MAKEKNGAKKPMGHVDEHTNHAACCDALEALACAAACVKRHQACCCEQEDHDGYQCCQESLVKVLEAIDLHTAHMRKCCG
jgi:hypothetical protein